MHDIYLLTIPSLIKDFHIHQVSATHGPLPVSDEVRGSPWRTIVRIPWIVCFRSWGRIHVLSFVLVKSVKGGSLVLKRLRNIDVMKDRSVQELLPKGNSFSSTLQFQLIDQPINEL